MASANEPGEKICALCHQDCSTRPRTKDDAGRYFCRACVERVKVERVKQERQHRQKSAPGTGGSRVEALSSDTDFDVLAEVADDTYDVAAIEVAAPSPPAPAIASRSDAPAAPAYEDREFNFKLPEFIKLPWFTFAVPALILYLLFDHARGNPGSAAAFLVPQFLFSMVVGIIILVEAFRDGIGTGFLTLCLPFYIFYYVLSVNESPHIKALFAVSMIASTARFFLAADLASSLLPVPGALP